MLVHTKLIKVEILLKMKQTRARINRCVHITSHIEMFWFVGFKSSFLRNVTSLLRCVYHLKCYWHLEFLAINSTFRMYEIIRLVPSSVYGQSVRLLWLCYLAISTAHDEQRKICHLETTIIWHAIRMLLKLLRSALRRQNPPRSLTHCCL